MTPELYEQIGQIYHAALDLEPEGRAEFLDQACDGNEEMRREVERLLAGHEQAGSFLTRPAAAGAAELLLEEATSSLIGAQLGRYKILSSIGSGGMGEVFLAQDTMLGRRVAIKLLPAAFTTDSDRVRRFEQEAKAASALNHPNIITIHEIGRAETKIGNLYFIAEEFIEGRTLRHRIKEGRLPLLDALDISIQAANAIQAAHAAGVVHRDMKPENIMLRPDGFIKILDFGLAKLTQPRAPQTDYDSKSPTIAYHKTQPGTILGTAQYMSPEQARGLDVDARSDIWSLGVVLYEMLAGQAPFKGMTPTDIIAAIVDREPQPLFLLSPKPPPELERIVGKALAKNRDERYQTAKDLAIDLKNLNQRLELDAEIARIPKPETTPEDAATSAAQIQKDEHIPRQTNVRAANAAPAPKTAPSRVQPAAAVLLAALALGLAAWLALRPQHPAPGGPPAPERQFTYWLTIQKMLNDKAHKEPFQSTGQEIFENKWKFKLNLISPQSGSLYILNEGPASSGPITYTVLFPFPSINNGSAQLTANQLLQTGWYVLDERPGTEKLLLIWAAQPAPELEAFKGLVNPKDRGLITNLAQLDTVREFLATYTQSKPAIETDGGRKQVNVRGRGEVLVAVVKLEHH